MIESNSRYSKIQILFSNSLRILQNVNSTEISGAEPRPISFAGTRDIERDRVLRSFTISEEFRAYEKSGDASRNALYTKKVLYDVNNILQQMLKKTLPFNTPYAVRSVLAPLESHSNGCRILARP